jgi:hypothetical protein
VQRDSSKIFILLDGSILVTLRVLPARENKQQAAQSVGGDGVGSCSAPAEGANANINGASSRAQHTGD